MSIILFLSLIGKILFSVNLKINIDFCHGGLRFRSVFFSSHGPGFPSNIPHTAPYQLPSPDSVAADAHILTSRRKQQ